MVAQKRSFQLNCSLHFNQFHMTSLVHPGPVPGSTPCICAPGLPHPDGGAASCHAPFSPIAGLCELAG